MRISEFYKLNRKQPSLDFIDVDIIGDTRVFVSPRAIRQLPSTWGDECVFLIQSFFETVLRAIREGKDKEARNLLGELREPNETHLGLSRGRARGRALGSASAHDVWEALSTSEAATSGLLKDLEDAALLVEGISADIVSDMTTNIIRPALISYTQDMCTYLGIPMEVSVDSGPLWDGSKHMWFSKYEQLPTPKNRKLLLVPKSIVRRRADYDVNEYFRDYVLQHLRQLELDDPGSQLVELLRCGKRRVTKKALIKRYGSGKGVVVKQTLQNPHLLQSYKRDKDRESQEALTHEELAAIEESERPDYGDLLVAVTGVACGRSEADIYEKAVEALLTALFYPALTHPVPQMVMHEGRKRVDITYTNMATHGFFKWVAAHYPAAHIFVECKNYGREIGNPEIDQISGRFSPSRGQVGLMVCRSFDDKDLFLKRCRDTAQDKRGFVIPLDDDDLRTLVERRKAGAEPFDASLLKSRFSSLVM